MVTTIEKASSEARAAAMQMNIGEFSARYHLIGTSHIGTGSRRTEERAECVTFQFVREPSEPALQSRMAALAFLCEMDKERIMLAALQKTPKDLDAVYLNVVPLYWDYEKDGDSSSDGEED